MKVWVWAANAPPTVLDQGDTIRQAAFSPDGTQVVVVGEDKVLEIALKPSGTTSKTSSPGGRFAFAALSHDGTRLITIPDPFRSAYVWKWAEGNDGQAAKGLDHGEIIDGAAFSPDDAWVVTAGEYVLKIWERADPVDPKVLPFNPFEDTRYPFVHDVAFGPDGTRVVTATADGLRIWPCSSCRPLPEVLAMARARLPVDLPRGK